MDRQYFAGTVTLPADGSAVPVCWSGPAGCLVYDPTSSGTQNYVGGPDVTPGTGFLINSSGITTIPGLLGETPAAVYPAPPKEPSAVLYACTAGSKDVTLQWLSGHPQTAAE